MKGNLILYLHVGIPILFVSVRWDASCAQQLDQDFNGKWGWDIAKRLKALMAWAPGCMCVSWFPSCILCACCFWAVIWSETYWGVLQEAPSGSVPAHLACDWYLRLILLTQLSCICINCGLELAPNAEAGISVSGAELSFEIPARGMHAIKGKSNQAETDHKPVHYLWITFVLFNSPRQCNQRLLKYHQTIL